MTPLEYIKEGIKNNDMGLVAQGFKELTGEQILIENSDMDFSVEQIQEPSPSYCVGFTINLLRELLESWPDSNEDEGGIEIKIDELDKDEIAPVESLDVEDDIEIGSCFTGEKAGDPNGLVSGKVNAKDRVIQFPMAAIKNKADVKRNMELAKSVEIEKTGSKRGFFNPRTKSCPSCGKDVRTDAKNLEKTSFGDKNTVQEFKCPHCRKVFST